MPCHNWSAHTYNLLGSQTVLKQFSPWMKPARNISNAQSVQCTNQIDSLTRYLGFLAFLSSRRSCLRQLTGLVSEVLFIAPRCTQNAVCSA